MDIIKLKKEIISGKIFIYPTDTIYGLGCNALDILAVEKIKKRDKNKPLSVIAPSTNWIKQNCIVKNKILKKYLPGPYTLLLKKKNPEFLKHISSNEMIGIRIPKNKFCFEIQKSGVPFVTTSVNISGEKPFLKINDIPHKIKNKVNIIIHAKEELLGKPSIIIKNDEEIKRTL